MQQLERGMSSLTSRLQRDFLALERRFTSIVGALLQRLDGVLRHATQSRSRSVDAESRNDTSAAPNSRYDKLISNSAVRNSVDPALVRAVVGRESGFRPKAVSNAGALGLMQLMPDTAKALGVTNPFDPAQNIEGGTRLLRELLDRYRGRVDLALAAYNAGTAAVDRYGGVPPFAETKAYVSGVMADYRALALGV
jgi:soluble lytic murein transglycosylase-like protein